MLSSVVNVRRIRRSSKSRSRVPLHAAARGLTPALAWLMSRLLLESAARSARVTSTYRTRAMQARLYRRALAGHSLYPAAPPGQSMHELGRAFDLGGLDPLE